MRRAGSLLKRSGLRTQKEKEYRQSNQLIGSEVIRVGGSRSNDIGSRECAKLDFCVTVDRDVRGKAE